MAGNVFLVGMMAVGKSTVGRIVAELLNLSFHDTDRVIEDRAGADISWIFDREGEEGFRDREEQVVDELTRMAGVVLATGGGAVLRASNRRHLSERGSVVYLHSVPEIIAARVRTDRHRPLLRVDDVEGRIETLCRTRDPLYRCVAHLVVEVDSRPPQPIATDVVSALSATGTHSHV